MRINYWSNGKLADWIRGTKKPGALGWGEWDDWDKAAKEAHPIRYWLVEEFLDGLQNIIYKPSDTLHAIVYWINRRFIDKSHIIRTGLKRGDWHETEEKILHGMFEELVTFVEVQKAHMSWHRALDDRPANDKFVPWTEKNWFTRNLTNWGSEYYGVQYLLWEITLTQGESYQLEPDNPACGLPTMQAESALEQLDLYVWWKYIRPMRPDPMDDSGYSEYFDDMRKKYGGGFSCLMDKENDEEKARQQACSKLCQIAEEAYDKEDTDNLIRLIKIRKSLWT